MDQEQANKLNRRSLEGFIRLMGSGQEDARVLEYDGVIGSLAPAVAERSIFNSVAYETADALAAARESLAEEYSKAGCAWTVWVPEDDTDASGMLDSLGHHLDGKPRLMTMEIDGFEEPDMTDIDWTGDGSAEVMARINDLAWGYKEGTFAAGMGDNPDGLHIYTANVDGTPAATVSALDVDGDCGIYCVATLEAARGKGLSTALMKRAIWDGAQRGCKTTTLQASKDGAPIYERLGYGDFGALELWEYRESDQDTAEEPWAS
jgi:GNAT superfamily N-acetyltransferase